MAVVSPPTVTGLGTPPSTSDPANFDARADALLGTELPALVTEINALGANVFANATDAASSATSAATQAGNASTSAAAALVSQNAAAASAVTSAAATAAPLWVSGATYAIGDVAYSPTSYLVYRRRTNGAGTTDPASDTTNWGLAAPGALPIVHVSGTTHNAAVGAQCVLDNVATTTVTLPASPAEGDVIEVMPANGLYTNVIDGNGKNINGDATMTIDNPWANVRVRYFGATTQWRIV